VSSSLSNANTSRNEKISKNQRTTVGPVPDLEHHLSPDWWKKIFNAMYLKTDGDVVENDHNTQKEIDLLVKVTKLTKDGKALDFCCGQGRHCIELAKRGFRDIHGLDRSRYLIRLAKKRAQTLGLSVSFYEGDVRNRRFRDSSFDCITLMGNSFGYFEQQNDDIQVLKNIFRLLKPNGIVAIDITDGEWMKSSFVARSWEWIDQQLIVNRERSLSADQSRLISRELVVHSEQGVLADQFYAERLYSKEEITQLLDDIGFKNLKNHGAILTESTRHHDLGMMGQRIFITGRAKKRSEIPKKKSRPFNVAVVMGDPSLPDAVKLSGKFNEEDLETVAKLKSALSVLHNFHFTYHSCHRTLFDELKTSKSDFVFNLCDEGFNNDALKELHVPAYLETLDMPYSGAGPVSLGICFNKSLIRTLAESLGIPVPMETLIDPDDKSVRLPSEFPAILKPNTGDSSIGITREAVVYDTNELVSYFNKLKNQFPDKRILVQEYLRGPEYTVGVIGNTRNGCEILPILSVDYSHLPKGLPQILGYESKWNPESPYWTSINYKQATHLEEKAKRQLQDYSYLLFERLECRDYARFDFRADADGTIKLLEVNPNPGWCWDGKMYLMAEFAGYSYSKFLNKILDATVARVQAKTPQKGIEYI
jgi:D-alanine-D-alanine ligase